MKIHSAADRKAVHDLRLSLGEDSQFENMLVLRDWTIGAACSQHDAHNALKWALAPLHETTPDATCDAIHISVASLRNGWSVLLSEMPEWLLRAVCFTSEPASAHMGLFWTCLGVEAFWVEELCQLQLRFYGDRLLLHSEVQQLDDWVDRVTACLMHLWKFVDFSSSRYKGIGDTSRAFCRGLASGLDSLVKFALSNPKNSKYYLGGWTRMSSPCVRKFVVVAALCSYVPDSFLGDALEDDRVAKHLDRLKESVTIEFEYVVNLLPELWDLLASLCDETPSAIKHLCISGSLRAYGFLQWRVFDTAEDYPWSLVRGDIRDNLHAFIRGEEPSNITASKIYRLAKAGFADELVEPLQLLAECSWSTRMCEQGHAPVTKLSRLHKEYSASTLSARACFILMHQLFTPTEEQKRLEQASHAVAALRRKNPNRLGGRQAYNKLMIEEATRARKSGKKVPIDMGKKVIAGTGKLWREMDEARKESFRTQARLLRSESAAELERRTADAESLLSRCLARVANDGASSDAMVTVSS